MKEASMSERKPIRRALISVYEKERLLELGQVLADSDIKIFSTGSTATTLAAAGIAVTEISSYTGFPEILDGRVKTLHPRVHSAILADQLRLYATNYGRISYVIHLGQIASPILNYKWRRYRGFNPHNHHIHISFRKDQDSNSEFFNIPLLGGSNE